MTRETVCVSVKVLHCRFLPSAKQRSGIWSQMATGAALCFRATSVYTGGRHMASEVSPNDAQ